MKHIKIDPAVRTKFKCVDCGQEMTDASILNLTIGTHIPIDHVNYWRCMRVTAGAHGLGQFCNGMNELTAQEVNELINALSLAEGGDGPKIWEPKQ